MRKGSYLTVRVKQRIYMRVFLAVVLLYGLTFGFEPRTFQLGVKHPYHWTVSTVKQYCTVWCVDESVLCCVAVP